PVPEIILPSVPTPPTIPTGQNYLPVGGNIHRLPDTQRYFWDVDNKRIGYRITNARDDMRQATIGRPPIPEGTKEVFTFLGNPYPASARLRAFETLARMFGPQGRSATEFYESIVQIPMMYHRGEWIPDPTRKAYVQVNRPILDTDRVTGNYRDSNSGEFAFTLKEGTADTVIEIARPEGDPINLTVFRTIVPIREEDKARLKATTEFTPEFGIALGEPTQKSHEIMTRIFNATGGYDAIVEALTRRPRPDMRVDYTRPGLDTTVLVPKIGIPIYTAHESVRSRGTVVELRPGYSTRYPDDRFAQLSLKDGNGLNIKMILHHPYGRTMPVVASFESAGLPTDPRELSFTRHGNTVIIGGYTNYRTYRAGGGTEIKSLPFVIEGEVNNGTFAIKKITIDQEDITPEQFAYAPRIYDEQTVENLQYTEIRIGNLFRRTS
ncbi:MAG TPA: hypothetical protein VJC18_06070, partial [bacterium]|nr:hypothetical protein [bacterium]